MLCGIIYIGLPTVHHCVQSLRADFWIPSANSKNKENARPRTHALKLSSSLAAKLQKSLFVDSVMLKVALDLFQYLKASDNETYQV